MAKMVILEALTSDTGPVSIAKYNEEKLKVARWAQTAFQRLIASGNAQS